MLIGYVSDERYLALSDVLFEFESGADVVTARSSATGAVRADLTSGAYRVTLKKEGYGGKVVDLKVGDASPYHFRLLSDSLLGYAWPRAVRSGEHSEFRVHSPEEFKLELFRYGLVKEHVRQIGWYDEHGPRANAQVTPDGDYSQVGARWNEQGYTNPHHKQYVAAPDRSGLYYFHATSVTGCFFSFPWVVAPSEPTARIAVLASDINWNAYNNFGGRSNYIHPGGLPDRPTVNARFELDRYIDPDHAHYKCDHYPTLSFDRPEPINHIPLDVQPAHPIEGRSACHVAPTEWRLLAWLEREGLEYDLYSETQLHAGTLDLDAYQILMLGPHPEYWTWSMVERVSDWTQSSNGCLMYLGGNGLNCEVEILEDNRMVVHNGIEADRLAAGKESRMHGRRESEAKVLGVVYDDRGIMTGAPYRVVDSTHWVFANTGLREGDLFGQVSQHERCPGGASGHETDKISDSSPPNTHLLAKGTNPDDGGAEMVFFETDSGGQVFSTGSINYVSSLLDDEAISQITRNVVERFLEDWR
ncbi:MAG: N,N-dimethylformamidase [Gemmatimonadetes bacterium]|nr:N,N-dimethylformamidase [Gemmatimonadota bacterium]